MYIEIVSKNIYHANGILLDMDRSWIRARNIITMLRVWYYTYYIQKLTMLIIN